MAIAWPSSRHLRPRPRRGVTLVFVTPMLVALIAFTSLSVDFGRVLAVRNQLQGAADAAALYGASGMSISVQTAINRAVAAAADNQGDAGPVVLDPALDIEFGTWDAATRTFAVLTGSNRSSATAIRITARRAQSRGNAVSLPFAAMVGRSRQDVSAVAIATRGNVITPEVDARACPWLAGMPNGSSVVPYGGNPQTAYAPSCSPHRVNGLPITPGNVLRFRQTAGGTGDSTTGGNTITLDGDMTRIRSQNPDNGINSTNAPLGALMGIFLDDRSPTSYAMAPTLNFGTAASRNFSTLSPQLKQVFYIGDGVNSSDTLQEFVVPAGATRLFLGVHDEKGWWWDNTGQINTTMLDDTITLVK